MSIAGYNPIEVPVFGGWNTLQDPDRVIVGMSPDLRDVEFAPGLVRTRPGLSVPYNIPTYSNQKANWLKTFINGSGTKRILSLAVPKGAFISDFSTVFSLLTVADAAGTAFPSLRANSISAFEAEYIAFSDALHGYYPGHSFDDSRFDRIGPSAPGTGTDITAFTTATENAAVGGNIVAGVHKMVVIFETYSGHRMVNPTGTPVIQFTASGAKTVDVAKIPTGPSYVKRRLLAFTPSEGSNYYLISSGAMVIDDNTTTTVTALDFSDTALLAGENIDSLFRLIELPYVAGMTLYNSRLVAWGELNRVQGFDDHNHSFDGGFDTTTGCPFGWERVSGTVNRTPALVNSGEAIQIDGTASIRQRNTSKIDKLVGLQKNVAYRVQAWVTGFYSAFSGFSQARLNIALDASGSGPGLQVNWTDTVVTPEGFGAATFKTLLVEAELTPANANIGTGTKIKIFVDNVSGGAANGGFIVDDLRIFPTAEPYNDSIVRVSLPDAPDAFDGIDGLLSVAPENGQAIRHCFELRGFLYLVKERSLYVTQDTGNPPAQWEISEVSNRVGTPSLRGVGKGDEWAVIASRSGLWFFDGGPFSEDKKLSLEITPTWDSINWTYGHLVEVLVDTQKKRILVSAPMGAATEPNRILVLDYTEGFGEGQRKWNPWYISANALAQVERTTGVANIFFGNNASNGKIYQLTDGQRSDDGAAINSYYQTAFLGDGIRNLYGYLSANTEGNGGLIISLFRGDQADVKTLRAWQLYAQSGFKYFERQINQQREQLAVKFGTNEVGSYFTLKKMTLWAKPSPYSPVRGRN